MTGKTREVAIELTFSARFKTRVSIEITCALHHPPSLSAPVGGMASVLALLDVERLTLGAGLSADGGKLLRGHLGAGGDLLRDLGEVVGFRFRPVAPLFRRRAGLFERRHLFEQGGQQRFLPPGRGSSPRKSGLGVARSSRSCGSAWRIILANKPPRTALLDGDRWSSARSENSAVPALIA